MSASCCAACGASCAASAASCAACGAAIAAAITATAAANGERQTPATRRTRTLVLVLAFTIVALVAAAINSIAAHR